MGGGGEIPFLLPLSFLWCSAFPRPLFSSSSSSPSEGISLLPFLSLRCEVGRRRGDNREEEENKGTKTTTHAVLFSSSFSLFSRSKFLGIAKMGESKPPLFLLFALCACVVFPKEIVGKGRRVWKWSEMMEGVLFFPWWFGFLALCSGIAACRRSHPAGRSQRQWGERTKLPSFPPLSFLPRLFSSDTRKTLFSFLLSFFFFFSLHNFLRAFLRFLCPRRKKGVWEDGVSPLPSFLPSSQYEICGGTSSFLQRGQQKKQNPIPGPFPVKNLGLFPGPPPPLFCLSVCETLRSFSSVYVYPSHICN